MTDGRLRRAVAAAVRGGGRVGAARQRRAQERILVDPDKRARRERIRTSVDGILRGLAGRYGFDLDGGAFPTWGTQEPRDIG